MQLGPRKVAHAALHDLIASRLPRRPYCTDNLDHGLILRSPEVALGNRHELLDVDRRKEYEAKAAGFTRQLLRVRAAKGKLDWLCPSPEQSDRPRRRPRIELGFSP